MPCACKKKHLESISVVDNTTQLVNTVNLLKLPIEKTLIYKLPLYDTTPTVKPLDTCAYCAMKHIALAALLQLRGDYFSAAGLMQLAGYHYNTANKELSKQCKNFARLFITLPLSISLLSLLSKSMLYPAEGDSKLVIPNKFFYDPVLAMVHLAAAQALMYTEIFYLHLNKGYAIGELVLAALYIQLGHRDIARSIRQVWKILQLMKEPNDKPYKDAQLMLLRCKGLILHILQLSNNTQGANVIPVN